MKRYYSPSTKGFYCGTDRPDDCVEITEADYNALLAGESTDMLIMPGADGYPELVPATSLMTISELKQAKIAELTASYNSVIQQPVGYMATMFQADTKSKSLIKDALAGFDTKNLPAGFFWRDIDNVNIGMNYEQLQGLSNAIANMTWTAFQNLQEKKGVVSSATTATEIMAILF